MRYDAYYELSEKQGWRVNEIDWGQLAADAAGGELSAFDRGSLVGTAVIEHGVPHYADVWGRVGGLRDDWELWQFTTLWTGEEHRHSYALQKACEIVGVTDQLEPDLAAVRRFAFADAQKRSCEGDCYSTVPGMLTYAMIQELATNRFYTMAAKAAHCAPLKRLLGLIAGDEMRHHVFFRDALHERYERADDRAAFVDQVFTATMSFKMPHLIYDLQVPFFESDDWKISEELLPQLARCFSFDMSLIARLVAARSVPHAA